MPPSMRVTTVRWPGSSPRQSAGAIPALAFTATRRTGEYVFWTDTLISLQRIFIGLSISAVIGLVIGIPVAFLPTLRALFGPFIAAFALIPPLAVLPILFIIFAIFTETSIAQLFLAGIVPGLLSLIGYALVIYIWVKRSPEIAPLRADDHSARDKWSALLKAWPAFLLFLLIIGGIYGGVFTATEAAALSLIFAVVLGLARRTLGLRDILPILRDVASTTGGIFFIAACAKVFVTLIALTGLSNNLVTALGAADIGPWLFIAMVCLIYLVLGMFLDPIGIMVLTLPLMIPMVESYGFNLIWFGVIIVKLLEIGLITPPVGLNVFVLASAIEERISIGKIFSGIWRFLVSALAVLILIVALPALSLAIPTSM